MAPNPSPDHSQDRTTGDLRLRVAWALIAGTLLVTAGFGVLAANRSHFFCDDMQSLFLLRTNGPAAFLLTPINVQVVPLHRLVTWGYDLVFGYRFVPAVCLLLVMHGLSLVMLHRVTRQVMLQAETGRTPRGGPPARAPWLPIALTLAYAMYPLLGIHFLWFSSGLHRIPYALATFVALDRWLSYRISHRPLDLLWVVTALLCAAGFYAKGPLVALHVAALELALWPTTVPAARRRAALGWVPVLGAAALAALAARGLAGDGARLFIPDPAQALALQVAMGVAFVNAFVGQVPSITAARPDMPSVLTALILLGVLVVVTVRARRRNLLVWLLMLACVFAHVFVLTLSNRGSLWGVELASVHRYYLDHLVIVVPLLAAACAGVRVSTHRPAPWAVAGCAGLLALGALNLHAFYQLLDSRYAEYTQTRRFVDTFEADLARVERALPAAQQTFQDDLMPRPMFGMGVTYRKLSHMAVAMGKQLRFHPEGRLVIRDDGSIRPRGPDYDPGRRRRELRPYLDQIRALIEQRGGPAQDR